MSVSLRVLCLILPLALSLGGCAGRTPLPHAGSRRPLALTLPHEGDHITDVRVYYAIPILQKSFFWDGNSEVDSAGLRIRQLWQVENDVALGVGLAATNWFLGGPDVQSIEAEGVGRAYVYRSDDDSYGVFCDVTGGFQQATDSIPPGGTEWNFTFSFGPGVVVPLQRALDLQTGLTYHHISNALGRDSPRNPSQNEAQLWIGLAFRF